MAMSREISINVHPEFRVRATEEDQGKPRMFRSSSLPSGTITKSVTETSDPSKVASEEKSENTQKGTEVQIQGIIQNENDEFSEFLITPSLPEHSIEQNFGEAIPGELHISEETEERRHSFSKSPVVSDLVKMFESYYSSDPSPSVKMYSKNVHSADSSGGNHLAPKMTRRNPDDFNRSKTSFVIPIKVEFDERTGNRKEENDFRESKVQRESVIQEGDSMRHEPTKSRAINNEVNVSVDWTKDQDGTDLEKPDENSEETDGNINHEEANTEQGQSETNMSELCEPLQSPSAFQPHCTEAEHSESNEKLIKIQSILNKAYELEKEVDAFGDSYKTKEYLMLEEVFTCCLIDLDGIEANGDKNVRLARKKAVQLLQQTLARLEGKVTTELVKNKSREEERAGHPKIPT